MSILGFRPISAFTMSLGLLLFGQGPSALQAESLPEHVSYRSLCCLLDELKSSGIQMTFETGEITRLEDDAIRYWKGKTFLFMKQQNASWLFPETIQDPEKWLENRYQSNHTTVEFQRLKLGEKSFLISLYSTSPVTRTSVIWSEEAEFRFSVQGDLLAVDPPSWRKKRYRLFFWNPTGSDLAIVDYDPSKSEFRPVLAVVDSNGTFEDGGDDTPDLPLVRREYKLDTRIRLFDHFSEFKQETGYLEAGTTFWHLGSRKLHLIAYRMTPPELTETTRPYHWSRFFQDAVYTTAWIETELP